MFFLCVIIFLTRIIKWKKIILNQTRFQTDCKLYLRNTRYVSNKIFEKLYLQNIQFNFGVHFSMKLINVAITHPYNFLDLFHKKILSLKII